MEKENNGFAPVEDFLGKVNHEKYPDVTQENKFELQNILSKRHG